MSKPKDAWCVKTTDSEGEEWLNGPFATKQKAYAWASKHADDFLHDYPHVPKSWLDADGESCVWVMDLNTDEAVFEATVLPLSPAI